MLGKMRMPNWRPGTPVPYGYYRSVLHPDRIFRRRHELSSFPLDISVRHVSQSAIKANIEREPYAAEGKRLSSEDSHRYGAALSNRGFREYFEWRVSVGLVWWLDMERRYQTAANDNGTTRKAVAA